MTHDPVFFAMTIPASPSTLQFFQASGSQQFSLTADAKCALGSARNPAIVILFGKIRKGKSTIGNAFISRYFHSVKKYFVSEGGLDACTHGFQFF
jgi:hypothetical protein